MPSGKQKEKEAITKFTKWKYQEKGGENTYSHLQVYTQHKSADATSGRASGMAVPV